MSPQVAADIRALVDEFSPAPARTSRHCECPKCGAVLADAPIPVAHLSFYGGVDGVPMVCPYGCGRPKHFSRLIGIYDTGADRTVAWRCPDCGERWPR